MGYTLEQFAAACHRLLAEEPGPEGREKATHLGDGVPERKILYEDPQLGFCVLAHVYRSARESPPHDHGPSWAIYGQARGETVMTDWAIV